jgi:ATP-dependent exoDNAse (exonuclease V) beta subunit
MPERGGLTIYKASAGSGKTFSLVGEYLKLLCADAYSYKHILAVTFTNKATAEMKERILKELSALSRGGESKYLDILTDFGSEGEIRRKATIILKLILHDYSRFSVMTIDSFFQKVIRSFAREIKLNASFKTEIDNRQALEHAVDLMFQEIDSNELLKSWMVMFLEDNLEEGRSWDFKKELLKFGKEVEKETFKVHGDELLETLAGKEQLNNYVAGIKKLLKGIEDRLKKFGLDGLKLISEAGLTYDQLKGGRTSFSNHFNKLAAGKIEPPGKTVLEACDNPGIWSKKTDSNDLKDKIEKLYYNGLNQVLKDSIEVLLEEFTRINTAQAILKNIYPFGLLGNIAIKIKEVLADSNSVLLSDSGRIIGKIIEGNDTPFIYEKVGMIYHHFMLDEFQDTSRQQWMNFRPLIENAIASGNSSLVVGDVKQSIYRWRNGDWNLLANQLAADLSRLGVETKDLNINWRSKQNIVDFNNSLFMRASQYLNGWLESETGDKPFPDLKGVISGAYSDQLQTCPQQGNPGGYVRLSFIEADGSSRKSDFMGKALSELIVQLEAVQRSGVRADEITILVRENSEAEKVAKALWERKKTNPQPGCSYDVITSDTLKIGQSPVVRFLVNFFRVFTRKETQPVRGEILYSYYRVLLPLIDQTEEDPPSDLHVFFDPDSPLPELFEKWLEVEEQSEFLSALLALPLFEIVVLVADHFRLGKVTGEKVYLQAFMDLVLEYGRGDYGGIPGFLDWWESAGSNKTINLPSVKNFIRISSIHQSKGLEYHTVFIPFCNWEIALNAYKPSYLWAVPEGDPFDFLNIVLVKCDSTLRNSAFSHDYYTETMLSTMDNLNLLYVAMTRAVNHLFVIMPYKEGNNKPGTVGELIQHLVEQPFLADSIDRQKYIDFENYWNPVTKILESGQFIENREEELSEGEKISNDMLILNSNSMKMNIRLHSRDYFRLTGDNQTERINRGTVMHQVFENIKTRKDVGPAVNSMVSAGLLTVGEGGELFTRIDGLLQQSPYMEWFDDQWKVLNERDILRYGETKHRPDRVMLKDGRAVVIDYKTGEKSDKDTRQMRGYLSDLKSMGYSPCEGNIWYLAKDEIVKVELV